MMTPGTATFAYSVAVSAAAAFAVVAVVVVLVELVELLEEELDAVVLLVVELPAANTLMPMTNVRARTDARAAANFFFIGDFSPFLRIYMWFFI